MRGRMSDLDRAIYNKRVYQELARRRLRHLKFLYVASFGGVIVYLIMRLL